VGQAQPSHCATCWRPWSRPARVRLRFCAVGRSGAGAVEVLRRGCSGPGELLLPGQLFLRKGQGGLGLTELGLEGFDFRGPSAFPGVLQARAGLCQTRLSFVPGGLFRRVLQGEERVPRRHLGTPLHAERLERACQRRRHVDELTLDVALQSMMVRTFATLEKTKSCDHAGDADKHRARTRQGDGAGHRFGSLWTTAFVSNRRSTMTVSRGLANGLAQARKVF